MELKDKLSAKYKEADMAYELSALIYADSFFYALFDYGHKLAKGTSSSLKDISKAGLTSGSIATIRKSKLGLLNSLFTIVPKEEYVHDATADYVIKACGIADPDAYIYRSDYIPTYGIRVCYAIERSQMSLINNLLEVPSLLHYVSAAIGIIEPKQEGLNCFIIDGAILIIGIKNEQLCLCNVYQTDAIETSLYYISLAYEESGLKDLAGTINVYGNISKGDELTMLIESYHGQIYVENPPITCDKKELDNGQQYMPLYAISKCG